MADSGVLERVIALLREREEIGLKTYGVTLDDQPDAGYQGKSWERMALEEVLDALMYCVRMRGNTDAS